MNGLIVLINRDPAYVQVPVGKSTIQQAFIRRCGPASIDPDVGVQEQGVRPGTACRVQYVNETLAQVRHGGAATPAPGNRSANQNPSGNTGAIPPAPATPRTAPSRSPLGGMGSWLCIGAAVLLVIVLFRRCVHAQGSSRKPPVKVMAHRRGYPQGGYQSPGSGAGRGFLGGLLGGALGGYAYDRFMRRPGDSGGGGSYSDPAHKAVVLAAASIHRETPATSARAAAVAPAVTSVAVADSGGGDSGGGGGGGGGSGGDF